MPKLMGFDEVNAMNDPAPNWRWVVRMPQIPISGGQTLEGLESARTGSLPFGMVSNIEFSVRSIDADQRFGGGHMLNYPRQISLGNTSITFFEDVKYSVSKYIRSWQNLIIDNVGNYGLPRDYKHEISLFAFDYVSNTMPVFIGTLQGCWPVSPGGYNYGYDSSGPVSITVDFAIDLDKIEFGAGFGFGINGGATGFLGRLQSLSQQVRETTGQVRSAIQQVTAPIREAVNTVRQVVNTGQEILQAGRQIQNEIMQPIRQVRGAIDEVRGFAGEFRSASSSLISAPRNEFNAARSSFRGLSITNT